MPDGAGPLVSPRRRLAVMLPASVAFGVLMALVKGQSDDLRGAVGNMSAPWVVLPFVAGVRCRRPSHGALAGVATTVLAFAGFYAAEAAILDLGAHPWYVDLRLTLGTVNVYERMGLLSGAVYGALGAVWGARRSLLAASAVGAAFLAEPFLVFVVSREGFWGGPGLLRYPLLWIAELVIGTALLAAAPLVRRSAARRLVG